MILGVDIGGTNIKFGVVDNDYNIIFKKSIKTNTEGGDLGIVADICDVCTEIKKEYEIEKIGVGTPGTVDFKNGICIRSANLPYNNTPIVSMIREKLNLPVYLANDASCAICGELYAGNGRKYDNLIMLTLGTGVGGGIIIDSKPFFGSRGGAGEFGHLIIETNGIECKCGQRGCLEKYASVSALISQTKEAAMENKDSLLAEMCREKVSGRTAFDAMKKGCPVAEKVVDKYIYYISVGITSLMRIFQPDAVVLGGAITNEGDFLLSPLKEKIALPGEIIISELKNDAGVIGAAAIAVNGDLI